MHLACAIWTPEVYFEQAAELRGMRLDDLTAERMELLCGACKQVRYASDSQRAIPNSLEGAHCGDAQAAALS